MATVNLNPNQDVYVSSWSRIPSGNHYQCVDEGTTQNTDDYVFQQGRFSTNSYETLGFATYSPVTTVSQVVVHVYVGFTTVLDGTATIDLYLGSWLGSKSLSTGGPGWQEFTWSGLSATQAQLDGMQVKITALLGYSGGCVEIYDQIFVYTIYATVTYSYTQPGWSGIFMGISSTNIATINGISLTDVAKVKGIG